MDIDRRVKTTVYRHIARTTQPPTLEQVGAAIGVTSSDVRSAFGRLYHTRVLVLEPDNETIRMAPPFSGVPTQHRVVVDGKTYMANCAWDALGVAAALHADADIHSRCEQTMEPLHLRVRGGRPEDEPCIVHYAVPAAHWWDDIVYT